MSRTLLLPVLVLGITVAPDLAQAQGQAYSGAFAREYPEAAELLNGFRAAHASLLEQMYTTPGITTQQLEGAVFERLADQVRDGGDRPLPSIGEGMPRFSGYAPNLVQIFDRAHALQRDIYDVYSDTRVTDKYAAAEAAIDRYLSNPTAALSPTKKSMSAMEDHDMHAMHDGMTAMGFRGHAPKTNGLLWASNWLELALSDPLMYYTDEEQREDGVENTVERFYELIESPPQSTPQEMPTPAAVTPELVRLHPRAAAIFHNLHMLQDEVVNVLSNPSAADKRMALDQSLAMFQDHEHMTVSDYDWIVFSLRNGIFFQGGPAIGRLERPERNIRHAHGNTIMPGMPGPSSGGAPAPEGSGAEPEADQGGGAHQH